MILHKLHQQQQQQQPNQLNNNNDHRSTHAKVVTKWLSSMDRESSLMIKNQFADPTKLFKESRYDGDDSSLFIEDDGTLVKFNLCHIDDVISIYHIDDVISIYHIDDAIA